MCVADPSRVSTGHLSLYLPEGHGRPQKPEPGQVLSRSQAPHTEASPHLTMGGDGLSPPSRTVLPARSLPQAGQVT